MNNQFAKGYSEAIFDIVLENNSVDLINDQFNLLVKTLKENQDFIKVINHPKLSKEEKKQIVKDVYSDFNQVLLNFMFVLIDNDRVEGVFDIHESFVQLYNEYQNLLNVKAYTTLPLEKAQVDRLKVKLMIKYRHKIEVHNIIDPQIVGGMRLVINEDVMDYTIQNQLINLKSHVLKQI